MLIGALFLLVSAPVAAQTKTFSITERARAAEGASASLTITLSEDAPSAGVAFTVAAGFGSSSTAEAADVMSIDSPVTIPSGTRSLTIAIPLTDDDIDEDEETFTVTIATTAEGWMKEGDGKDTAVVAIDDDDNAGVNLIGVRTISNDEGKAKIGHLNVFQNTPVTYQVVLTSRPVADVTINVSATMWNSVSPASHTFDASSANDWKEPKEFTVTAGRRLGSALILHTVTTSDPNYGTLQYSDWSHTSNKLLLDIRPPLPTRLTLRADRTPVEGEGAVTVTATLDNPAPWGGTTVKVTPSGTAAGEGTDYTLSSTTISIGYGQTTGTMTITVTDDNADDDDETIVLEASGGKLELTSNRLTLTIEDNDQAAQQQRTESLTAAFERAPGAHDGTARFWFNVRFSEALGDTANAPAAASFAVTGGKVKRVRQLEPGLWRVRITPKSWRDVTVTLAGGRACGEAGAVCTADGRALSNTSSVTVGGPVRIRVAGARAKEGMDASLDFAVTLNRAASHEVSVDYATEDGTAAAGADYTATSGTLVFAAGETAKTVSVPLLDDAIDEGKETMRLKLSNPKGAYLRGIHTQAKGVIRNEDPLQEMWLARVGRTVAADAVASVTSRLETPRDAPSHLTLAGQRVNLGQTDDDGTALAETLTGLAQMFGAPAAPAADGPLHRHDLTSFWNQPAVAAQSRRVTGRELLLGSSFRAVLGRGAGSQWTSWGQGASASRFSAAAEGLNLSSESATGSMGMDYERGRLLMGLAMTHSVGEGKASDAGWRYELGSTATMAMPYARLALSERVSVWGLAGTGSGALTIDIDGSVPQSYRTGLAMTLAAAGVRGDLVKPAEAGGFALALKADSFWVRAESDRVVSGFGHLAAAQGESNRVRAVLDGSRTFSLASGATLAPSLEFGLRHDGGDAETGTGLEFGTGFGFADPSRGLDMTLKAHGLAVHADDGYEEWGVTGQLRLVPEVSGRGLMASLTPSWGVDPSGSQRLWALPASSGLAANGEAVPSSRLDGEFGYGMALLNDRFTGTPHVGFGFSEAAREYRMGWRLTPAVGDDLGFEVSLDATRREASHENGAEHGVMLQSLIRW